MAVFKCKMCGGHLEIGDGAGVVTCEYCGNKQTIPKFGAEKVASFLEKADNFRNAGEFDKAIEIYEKLLDNNDAEDPELYWNIALCKYGVKYEKDPVSKEYIPTVNRLQYTSILNDENYKKALELSYSTQKDVYENQAKAIDKIQQEILQISKSEEPYDVFICYKETDESGRRTQDSLYAYKIYERLTKEGLKVFYARVTLEDKIGKYEPYIFAALHSARVMIVIGSKKEYFEATWVKNEWSRYLQLLKDKAISRNIVPCYKDMDPYEMPSELAYLQAQDMNKVGFEEDLVRGINKIIKKPSKAATHGGSENNAVGNYLKRVEIYLNDGDYENASLYCEKALDLDAENAEAYKYKLFTDYNVKNKAELIEKLVSDGEDCDNKNLNNAIKFGCSELNVIKYLNYRSESWEKYKNIIKFQTTLESDINEITKQFASIDETDDNVMKQKLDNIFDEYIYNKGLKALSTDDQISILAIDLEYKDAREQLNKIFEEEKAKCANISELHDYDIDNCLRHFQNLNNYMDCNDIIGILEAEKEERQRRQYEERQRKEDENKRQKAIDNRKKIKRLLIACAVIVIIVMLGLQWKRIKFNSEHEEDIKILSEQMQRIKDAKTIADYPVDTPVDEIETVTFGNYIYDKGKKDNKSYTERKDIEWIVIDKKGNKALLLSKYVLDVKGYNKTNENVTWDNCTLRSWLNEGFYNKAFDYLEKDKIQKTNLINTGREYGYSNGITGEVGETRRNGKRTKDKVFCLSVDEVEQYFNLSNSRSDKRFDALSTPYVSNLQMGYAEGLFWLRTAATIGASVVAGGGRIWEYPVYVTGVDGQKPGVRPAIWVKY